jgi:hypothetical protein
LTTHNLKFTAQFVKKNKTEDIKRYQSKHSAPKGEGACTIGNTILMETRPMVSSNKKQEGKEAMEKEVPSDGG